MLIYSNYFQFKKDNEYQYIKFLNIPSQNKNFKNHAENYNFHYIKKSIYLKN
jgi:hypothetical protein